MNFIFFFKKTKRLIFYLSKRFYHELIVFRFSDNEKIFTKIYKNNYWDSNISKSGPGSDYKKTKKIRKKLPKIIKKYNIRSIFDAPCGDFFWIKKIILKIKIKYIGADIVKEMIEVNKKKFSSDKIQFIKLNLITSKFPKADLWICRALFFHLDFYSIRRILQNLKKSRIKYVLLTNSPTKKNFINKDIIVGNFRNLDLFKAPFHFPKNYLYKFKDTLNPHTKKLDQEMIFWEKKNLISILNKRKKK